MISLGPVGELVLGVVGRSLRQALQDLVQQQVGLAAVQGRNGNGLGKVEPLLPLVQQGLHFGRPGQIGFVEHQENGHLQFAQLLQDGVVLGIGLRYVGHEQHQVGILKSAVHKAVHHLLHLIGRRLDVAGGVRKDDLEFFAAQQADDAVARSLRLGRDDAHPLAHQGVHQGGFAHIGPADDVDESGAVWGRHGYCVLRLMDGMPACLISRRVFASGLAVSRNLDVHPLFRHAHLPLFHPLNIPPFPQMGRPLR